MLPASEFERLSRLDHLALSPQELSDEAIHAIRTATPSAGSVQNDQYVD
ncbi:type II toxin-antitoxin system Phd/YefM family antitoxin, partial [Enterococcus faecium]